MVLVTQKVWEGGRATSVNPRFVQNSTTQSRGQRETVNLTCERPGEPTPTRGAMIFDLDKRAV